MTGQRVRYQLLSWISLIDCHPSLSLNGGGNGD